MRIVDFNYAFEAVTHKSASSSDSEFPVSNMAKHTRSEVWRSSGYFVIDATNNKLDFSEGGGELTATLTASAYTPSELAAEIKTQMESAGALTYTVSFSSSTGKWTIAGSGTFSLLWNTGTNTATSVGAALGFDTSADDSAAATYTAAAIALHTEEWVLFDLGTWNLNPVDTFAVLFDPVNGPQLSNAAVLKVQANQTPNFTSPAVDVTLSIDEDFVIATQFWTTDQDYRYWRVKVVDPANALGYVELAGVFLGKSMALTQNPEVGIKDKLTDNSRRISNQSGNEYYDVEAPRASLEGNWRSLSESDHQLLKQMFWRVGQHTPILVSVDPTEGSFGNKDEHTLYGRLITDFDSAQSFYTYWDFSMQVLEVI